MKQEFWHDWEGRPYAKVMDYFCERVAPAIGLIILAYALYRAIYG